MTKLEAVKAIIRDGYLRNHGPKSYRLARKAVEILLDSQSDRDAALFCLEYQDESGGPYPWTITTPKVSP